MNSDVNKTKKEKSTFFTVVTTIVPYVNLLMAPFIIWSICRSFPRDMQLDYWGIILAILGLLTTVLIGWQIYSIMRLEDIKKSVKKTEDNNLQNITNSLFVVHSSLSDYYFSQLKYYNGNGNISELIHRYIYETLGAIDFSFRLNDKDTANHLANVLLENIRNNDIYIESSEVLFVALNNIRNELGGNLYDKLLNEIKSKAKLI